MLGVVARVGVVAGLVASVLVAGGAPAGAQESRTAALCDTAGVTQFDDVSADEYGADYVLCMRALGLSTGRADGTYGPDLELTRAQMASFIVRLWRDVLNRTCPDVEAPFTDVAPDSVHAANIACLYGLGITTGKTATTYEPQARLTASQIARFLMRTYRQAADTCGTASPDLEEAVAYLRGLKVIPHAGEGTGAAPVTRAQMAVYLIGLWHNIAGRGLPPTPPQRLPEPAPADLPAVPFSMGDFVNGDWLRWTDPELAASINELGWVQDGVDEFESSAVQELLYTAVADRRFASTVVSLGWVQDGIDGAEADAIQELSYISRHDAAAALRIAGMPFAATMEPLDVLALDSLSGLASFRPEVFDRIMSHPALRDGISDGLAPVVATLGGVATTNPDLIDVLLDPGMVSLERRTVESPLSGEIAVYIVRTGAGAARSMELLRYSIRCVEEAVGAAFPTNAVVLLFEDAVSGSAAGTNFGTHIAVRPEYDVDAGSFEAENAGHIVAHEVAHYYWRGNADWIDEGAADFTASIVERARVGSPLGVTNHPCASAGSIAELERQEAAPRAPEFYCNYALGERLFVDLYRSLGAGSFHRAFRDLYLLSQADDAGGAGQGTSLAVEQVKEAFRSNDGTEDTVIARWYDGTEPYDLGSLDLDPVDPGLPSINGRVDSAHIVIGENDLPVSGFSARDIDDWVGLKLEFSYRVNGESEVPLRIVEFYEDGLEFNDTRTILSAGPGLIGESQWWSVGAGPTREWAPGRYWVYVYANGHKVAEVDYLVTP